MKNRLVSLLLLVLVPVLALSQSAAVKELFGPRTVLNGAMICWNGGDGAHGASCDSTTTFLASPYPKKRVYIRTGTGLCTTTNGCAAGAQTETSANLINYFSAAFAKSATNCWQVDYVLPNNYASGTNFSVAAVWVPDSDTTGGNVFWQFSGVSVASGEAIDAAQGTLVTTASAWLGAAVRHLTADTTFTAAGTPAGNETLWIQVCRLGSSGSDTLTGGANNKANLLGIYLAYQVSKMTSE